MSLRPFPGAALLVLLAFPGGAEGAAVAVQPETVEARVGAGAQFRWTSRFEASVQEGRVLVRVGVHLVPAGGVTRAELERVIPGWTAGAEGLWGRRLALETEDGERYPVVVSVDFRGPGFHHDVVVRPGRGRADQLDWHAGDPPEVVAHEVGHMLGAHDDYEGGANGPRGAVEDPGSLMGADPQPGASPRARHLEGLRGWFAARTGLAAEVVVLETRPAAPQLAQGASSSGAGLGGLP